MYYAIYLLGVIFLILRGIGGGFKSLINYMDGFTCMFILVPCILTLFCTRSLKAFGRAFLFVFGKQDTSPAACEESHLAVRMVLITSLVFGNLAFLIGTFASIRSIEDFSSIESLGWIICDMSVSMISLLYPLLIWTILLPLCFILGKYRRRKKPESLYLD